MSKKILIIEDEEFLVDVYKTKLENEGFEVIVAYDGEKGMEKAKKEKPDLILLDLVIPKKSGFQVFNELKNKDETKDIKVCILTNLGIFDEIEDWLKDRADGYLVKANITPSDLIKYLEDVFSGKKVTNVTN